MSRLEFRLSGLDERDLGLTPNAGQDESDLGQRGHKIERTFHNLLSGTKAVVLTTALAAAAVVHTINSPAVSGPPSPVLPSSSSSCLGEWRTAFTLNGMLYKLPDDTSRIPDFSQLVPIGTTHVRELQIANREAFPRPVQSFSSFGIEYRGTFFITRSGPYRFSLASDDGSKLFIDDWLVINNDGPSAGASIEKSVRLGFGSHSIRLTYFEGFGGGAALFLRMCREGGR